MKIEETILKSTGAIKVYDRRTLELKLSLDLGVIEKHKDKRYF